VFVLGGYAVGLRPQPGPRGRRLDALVGEVVDGALADAGVDVAAIDAIHVGNAFGELFSRPGPARRDAGDGATGAVGRAGDAPRGRVRVGLGRAAGGDGRDRGRALRAARWCSASSKSATCSGEQAAQFMALGGVGRPRGRGRALPVAAHVRAHRRRGTTRGGGLDARHLAAIAAKNLANARATRWPRPGAGRSPTTRSPRAGPTTSPTRSSRAGCVASTAPRSPTAPRRSWWRRRRSRASRAPLATILGWGHRTAALPLAAKLERSADAPYLLPHLRDAVTDAYRRAGVSGPEQLDGAEVHDCFTITEYLAIDHLGVTAPGQAGRALDDGTVARGGRFPINPSGGLIGGGHPVGATGVRMVLDASRQVAGRAGDYQIDGARRFATLNLGGSGTTACAFVLGGAA
jgi:acetyl-CoA C-acetyltransferase